MESTIVKAIESLTGAIPKAIEAFNRLFPGLAERSKTNAASHAVRTIGNDVTAIMQLAEQTGMSQEMALSLINAAYEKHESDQRVAECFTYALPSIEDNGKDYAVDDEWLDYWKSHASKARTADVQQIWGSILANEVNKPGAISKHAMSILADMGKSDAEAFVKTLSLTVDFEKADGSTWRTPFLLAEGEAIACGAIERDDISTLIALGLLQEVSPTMFDESYKKVSYNDCTYALIRQGGSAIPINLADCVFTPYGMQLAIVTRAEPHMRLPDLLRKGLGSRGISIVEVEQP